MCAKRDFLEKKFALAQGRGKATNLERGCVATRGVCDVHELSSTRSGAARA